MSRLLEDSKTASATHNILGYRVLDQSTGRIVQVGCGPLAQPPPPPQNPLFDFNLAKQKLGSTMGVIQPSIFTLLS